MVPQVALVIPLYIVLARYPPGRTRSDRRDRHVHDVRAAVLRLDAARVPRSAIPKELEEAAMVDGSTPARRVRADPAAAGRAGARGHVGVRVHPAWNEYIFAYVLLHDQSKQTLTVWLAYFTRLSRRTDWGALMAGVDADGDPGVIFFLLVQRRIAVRAHGRRRQGMSADARAAAALPASARASRASRRPDWVRRRLGRGPGRRRACSPGTSRDAEQVAGLTASLRAERPAVLVSRGRGGRRRHPARGRRPAARTRETSPSAASTTSS